MEKIQNRPGFPGVASGMITSGRDRLGAAIAPGGSLRATPGLLPGYSRSASVRGRCPPVCLDVEDGPHDMGVYAPDSGIKHVLRPNVSDAIKGLGTANVSSASLAPVFFLFAGC